MVCPAGARHWAPEIPSELDLAGLTPGKYEPDHKWRSFFPGRAAPWCASNDICRSHAIGAAGGGRLERRDRLLDQACLDSGSLTGTWGDVLTTRGAPSA